VVLRGGTVTITGSGFEARAEVSVNVRNIETVPTRANSWGDTSVLVKMPGNAPLGANKFTATGLGANDQTLTLTTTLIVKIA
jgi:hypothetical protein